MGSVEQRFIESIAYLRKLGFFEEYSNLSSEEIFERMRERSLLLKDLKEEHWMKKSVYEIDRFVAVHDSKRWWNKDLELGYHPSPEEEVEFLEELAQISRGVFQPTDIEWRKDDRDRGVYFTFNGKRHIVRFRYSHGGDFLDLEYVLSQINRIIENTKYRYHSLLGTGTAFVVVLTSDETEKLRKERGWKLLAY